METAPADRIGLPLEEVRALAAARRWQELVSRASAVPEDELLTEPEVAFHFADGLWRTGEAPRARRIAERVEQAVACNGNRWLRLQAINVTGISLFQTGEHAHAETHFTRLLEYATEWGDDESAARAANNLGVIASVRGRHELALTCYQRALASYQRLGQLRGLGQTHHNLGISYRQLGFPRESDAHFRRAIEFGRRARSEDVIASAEAERAMLCTQTGDSALAESLAQRALERFERLGDAPKRGEILRILAAAARAAGDHERAHQLLAESLEIAAKYSNALLAAEVERDRALLLRDRGEAAAAREAFRDAAERFSRLGAEAEAAATRALARNA